MRHKRDGYAGARVEDARDPLALFTHDSQVKSQESEEAEEGSTGPRPIGAPVPGLVVSGDVEEGDNVRTGQPMATIELLELEHVVRADTSGEDPRRLRGKRRFRCGW